jgi:hypothetical protein
VSDFFKELNFYEKKVIKIFVLSAIQCEVLRVELYQETVETQKKKSRRDIHFLSRDKDSSGHSNLVLLGKYD